MFNQLLYLSLHLNFANTEKYRCLSKHDFSRASQPSESTSAFGAAHQHETVAEQAVCFPQSPRLVWELLSPAFPAHRSMLLISLGLGLTEASLCPGNSFSGRQSKKGIFLDWQAAMGKPLTWYEGCGMYQNLGTNM